MTHKSNHLTRFNLDTDLLEYRLMGTVTKGYVPELDFSINSWDPDGFLSIAYFWFLINYFKDPLRRCHGLVEPPGNKGHVLQRAIEQPRVSRELNQFAHQEF